LGIVWVDKRSTVKSLDEGYFRLSSMDVNCLSLPI
jgi:hypothetical protein